MVGRFFACPGSKTKGKTKRVENFFATCLDGGSIPPGSTKKRGRLEVSEKKSCSLPLSVFEPSLANENAPPPNQDYPGNKRRIMPSKPPHGFP